MKTTVNKTLGKITYGPVISVHVINHNPPKHKWHPLMQVLFLRRMRYPNSNKPA